MTQDEFSDLLTMIGKGEATPDELKDGLAYCAGTSMETGMMFRALVSGYGALTAAVERKDRKLRAAWEFTRMEAEKRVQNKAN